MNDNDKKKDIDIKRAFDRAAKDLKSARKKRRWSMWFSVGDVALAGVNMAYGNFIIAGMMAGFAGGNIGDTVSRRKKEKVLQEEFNALKKELDLRRLSPDGTLEEESDWNADKNKKESNFVNRKRKRDPGKGF